MSYAVHISQRKPSLSEKKSGFLPNLGFTAFDVGRACAMQPKSEQKVFLAKGSGRLNGKKIDPDYDKETDS